MKAALAGAITNILIKFIPEAVKFFAKKNILNNIVDSALKRLIKEFPVPQNYQDAIEHFLSLEPTVKELSKLITLNDEPDFEKLEEVLKTEGLDERTLKGIDILDVFDKFAQIFVEECLKGPALTPIINIRLQKPESFRSIYKMKKNLFEYYKKEFEYLPHPVRQMQNIVRMRLEDIFIPLSLIQKGEETREEIKREIEKIERVREKRLTREGKREIEAYKEILKTSGSKKAPKPIEFNEFLKSGDKLVILGDPGAGKTTILRYLTLIHSQGKKKVKEKFKDGKALFPIVVSIGRYADVVKKRSGVSLIDFLTLYYREQNLGDISRLFKWKLERGGCLVMFDGLDEVLDIGQRKRIVGAVEAFINEYSKYGNRFIITSRIVGYNEAPLSDDFIHFKVLPFGKEEIRRFAVSWYMAYNKSAEDDTKTDIKEAEREAETFINDVKETGIEHLITNPLLLTIAALIREAGKKLPNRRAELYRLYVEAFAETWHRARDIYAFVVKLRVEDIKIDEPMVVSALSPVAFEIHSSRPGGVITRKRLEKKLIDVFDKRYGFPSGRASTAARDFINIMLHQIGLMTERGTELFGFIHQIFEEYLCARYLCLLRERNRTDYIKKYLHHPRWEEPILLTLVSLEGENAEYLLRKIYKNKSAYEDILHRDLLLCAKALADDVDIRWVSGEKILDEVIELWEKSSYTPQIKEVENILIRMKGTKNEGYVGDKFLEILKNPDKDERIRAASFLIKAGFQKDKAIDTLMKLTKDKTSYFCSVAVKALGNLGIKNKDVVDRLMELTKDKVSYVRYAAAGALGNLGIKNKGVVDRLVELTKDKVSDVRSAAAGALGNLGIKNNDVVDTLMELTKDKVSGVRSVAAWALGNLGIRDKGVVDRLMVLIKDKNSGVRSAAVRVLGNLGIRNKDVVNTLVKLIKDEDFIVCSAAARALGNLGIKDKDVVDRLMKLTKDKSAGVRYAAVEALGNLGIKNKNAVDRLMSLTKDKSSDVRYAAAGALGNLGIKDKDVVDRLVKLSKDESPVVRYAAAVTLGSFGTRNKDVVDRLMELIKDKSSDVRSSAAEALVNLGIRNRNVVDTLMELIKDKNLGIRSDAAEALKKIGKYNKETVNSLYNTLKTLKKETFVDEDSLFDSFRFLVAMGKEERLSPAFKKTKYAKKH